MARQFQIKQATIWSDKGWQQPYKLVAYQTAGINFPIESDQTFEAKEDALAACARVNAGDESGLTFSSYSDD